MNGPLDRVLAVWIGLALPLALVAAPRIAQFFIGAAVAAILAASFLEARARGRSPVGWLKETAGTLRRQAMTVNWLPAHLTIAFGVFALVSAFWSIDPAFSAERALRFLFVVVLAVAFVGAVAPRLARLDPMLVVAGATMAAALGLVDWFTGAHILQLTGRPADWLEYNRLAQQCSALVFFVFWCPVKQRLMALPAVVLLAWFIVTSDNETAKAALVIGFFALIAFSFVPAKKAIRLSAAAFTALVLALPFIQPALLDVVAGGFADVLPARSHQIRLHIWHHIGAMLPDHAIIGAGFDATRRGPEIGAITLFDGTADSLPTPFHPHGQVLQIAYETGAVGLLIFIAFGLALIRRIGRLAEHRIPLALALFWGTFVAANIANGAFATWRLAFWAILIAFIMVLPVKTRPPSPG